MSSSPPPETSGAYIFDASTFLKGLRSISLRNLSLRGDPTAVAVGGSSSTSGLGVGVGVGVLPRSGGERDSASVTSANLRKLRAVIMMPDAGNEAAPPKARDASANENQGASTWGGRHSGGVRGAGESLIGNGRALLTTGVSQPTVNPTWPVSETTWLQAGATTEDLDSTRLLVLRVFAIDTYSGPTGDPQPPRSCQSSAQGGTERIWDSRDGVDVDESAVWECTIDVRKLTALPEGTSLPRLWALPADCLLVEMSNGGLYAPGWVVQALASNSALPEAVAGGGSRGRGDDSDEEDDEEEEPLEQALQRALLLEEAAKGKREELAAMLKKTAPDEKQACLAAETACAVETLRSQLSHQKELLEMEEASFLREKQQLEAEALAMEELLTAVATVEEAVAEDIRKLELEKQETLKSHVLLEARRARLTAELQAIYPIKFHEKLNEFTIRGLELPGDLYSIDDERISSALGYTAHLVCMLAKYLQIPLRYQVIYNASRSAVRDNVTGAGVAYPLFRKGVEKERFDRGVYLLGRDVEQMLAARGVPAKRGAGQILRNLDRLMSVEGA